MYRHWSGSSGFVFHAAKAHIDKSLPGHSPEKENKCQKEATWRISIEILITCIGMHPATQSTELHSELEDGKI